MSKEKLDINTITFGKYKGKTLEIMLKDRTYCSWILQEEWFEKNYEYLYNRVLEYQPRQFFLKERNNTASDLTFIEKYTYFNLKSLEELEIQLSENEILCYTFYLSLIEELKQKIIYRIEKLKENCFDIKAPTKWLQKFEKETNLKRDDFKDFMNEKYFTLFLCNTESQIKVGLINLIRSFL